MKRLLKLAAILVLSSSLVIVLSVGYIYQTLPDVESLRAIQLQVPLRVYSQDGKLITEFGQKKRIPVRYENTPATLVHAILATEDQRFFEHPGIDIRGLMRAALHVIIEGNRGQGGSTITMQVARNFFLSRKKTYSRKLNEILLAIKIERELSKEEILTLYLNKVFLGHRAYGVAAAASVYYGKKLDELTLAQYAMIAGLPKAPSAINPLSNPVAAKARRNHVLKRMLDNNYISQETYLQAIEEPITARYHGTKIQLNAPYISEMVRQELVKYLGDDVYTQGYRVITTIDSHYQKPANDAISNGLQAYDRRHGFRTPTKTLKANDNFHAILGKIPVYNHLLPGVVIGVLKRSINVLLANGQTITVPWSGLSWAKKDLGHLRYGRPPKNASEIVKLYNVIRVKRDSNGNWHLAQIPLAQSALVSLRAQDGAILALVGGFNFKRSKFNRVTQTQLQPGSNIKPFIYSAALNKGFTAASMINDAPVVYQDPTLEAFWRPENDNREFLGPTTLRTGLIKSRNLVSIRLLRNIGIDYTIDYITRFGFKKKNLTRGLSLALGTAQVSPLEMATGFSVFANGGFNIEPYFIERIESSNGKVIFSSKPKVACLSCLAGPNLPQDTRQQAPRAIDAQNAYIMNNILQDAIKRGTGRQARALGRKDIGGKTGTTNGQFDAWFSGFNRDIVTTVWVGYDTPRSLGEYAAKAALPIWMDYMAAALKDKPESTLPQPPGIVTVRIDPKTGLLARSGQSKSIFELFREQYAPKQYAPQEPRQPVYRARNRRAAEPSQVPDAPEQIF